MNLDQRKKTPRATASVSLRIDSQTCVVRLHDTSVAFESKPLGNIHTSGCAAGAGTGTPTQRIANIRIVVFGGKNR
jgi:hypothetical protein